MPNLRDFILDVSDRLGSADSRATPQYLPKDIIGAEILAIGAPTFENKPEGGGLSIVYKNKEGKVTKLVFAFNEEGMWFHDIIPYSQSEDTF